MSQQDESKTPTTIKIAAKDVSQRNSGGGADPGPGDPSAAPSVAPQLVDIPDPPTPSQLIVRSVKDTSTLATINETNAPKSMSTGSQSGGKQPGSKSASMQGSKALPMASNLSGGAAREPTSSKPLTGPSGANAESNAAGSHGAAGPKSVSGLPKTGADGGSGGSQGGGQANAGSGAPKSSAGSAGMGGAPKSTTGSTGGGMSGGPKSGTPKSSTSMGAQPGRGAEANSAPTQTASTAMQADSGAVHDEDEVGEGELEHADDASQSPSASPMSVKAHPANEPASSKPASIEAKDESQASVSPASSGKSGKGEKSAPSMSNSDVSRGSKSDKKKKKITKFRYHKRITVRTSGKTSPAAIMEKVNKKDHKVGITPSTIEDMDPQELMRRAGIKGNKQTHWRVRLRQTKRLTKNGKTTTQTKVAYRDSEGNKRIKTSTSPYCKSCGKKLEECKCDSNS